MPEIPPNNFIKKRSVFMVYLWYMSISPRIECNGNKVYTCHSTCRMENIIVLETNVSFQPTFRIQYQNNYKFAI